MAKITKIQWTNSTMNPWRGCTKVAEECEHCYADTLSHRNPKVLGIWGPKGTRVLASKAHWNEPLKWNVTDPDRTYEFRHLVFCASLADIFEDWPGQMMCHDGRPLWLDMLGEPFACMGNRSGLPPYTMNDARERLWKLIRKTPNLTWQILTKRPENISSMMPHGEWSNVWLGTSVGLQKNAWRIDALNEVPQRVPVKFVSAEPLLGPLKIGNTLGKVSINWLIIGGESGGHAREFRLSWCKDLIGQCYSAGIPCLVKQAGDNPTDDADRFPLTMISKKGTDTTEWPNWMRVREYPE